MDDKIYIKYKWDCGYAGTDGYCIDEYDEMPDEKELWETARMYHEESCGEYYWEQSDKKEFDEDSGW